MIHDIPVSADIPSRQQKTSNKAARLYLMSKARICTKLSFQRGRSRIINSFIRFLCLYFSDGGFSFGTAIDIVQSERRRLLFDSMIVDGYAVYIHLVAVRVDPGGYYRFKKFFMVL